ncbi:hypothetical protein [Natrinema sp. HArc-T2]|uniref:hypothetical protein n=1 Tax=Natrinema sp. HArc-T2 TaxID=3242701 RepID=UPI00359EC344
MERRKILLGSGAALATVLAGCSSNETDSSGNGNGSSDGNGNGNGDDTGSDDKADIPGLDRDKLKLESDKITIEDVNKDDDKIDVVATTTTTDPETLATELESLGNALSAAITDPEAFKAEINSVTWVLEKDGTMVMQFYVDVQWAIAYINGEMSENEFVQTVLDTADETP